jgi:outer membrane receptor protein involved in Fe transport
MYKSFIFFLALSGLFCCTAIAQEPGQKCLPGTNCPKDEEKCPPGANCPQKEKPRISLLPETITVTAGFQDGAVTLEPTKTVIDMTKFESSGSVDRVEDVLKHMTGIDVIQGTGGPDPQQVVMMRGFDDSRFQVAINGRPITAPTAGADTFVDWSSLTVGDIEQIEIIRGSASARYENSAGGIINIITKKGKKKEQSLMPKSSADASYSSFNTWNARGTMSGGVGQLGYFINFGNRISDGFLRNNYWNGMDYSGRLDYALPGKGSLSASFKRSEFEHGYPVVNDPNSKFSTYDSDYPILPDDADTLRMGRLISYMGGKSFKIKKKTQMDISYEQPFRNTNLSIKYFQDRGSEDSWSYQRNSPTGTKLVQTYQGSLFNPPTSSASPNDRKEKTFGVMFDYQMNFWAKHSITVGYSHRRMEVHNTPDIYRIQGVYVEDQYAVTNKLILNLGLRYMYVREYSYAYKAPGETTSTRHLIYTKLLLPKFTATYHFSPITEVFVSVNRDYHFPGC